jgi:mannosylglycerate hydrolase
MLAMSTQLKTNHRKTAHIVSHTHWDSEWRYPIWETRLMLTDFMDELVEVLEKGFYPSFLMDGQVSPILDYLKLRPEMADRIKALVKADKLQIGP